MKNHFYLIACLLVFFIHLLLRFADGFNDADLISSLLILVELSVIGFCTRIKSWQNTKEWFSNHQGRVYFWAFCTVVLTAPIFITLFRTNFSFQPALLIGLIDIPVMFFSFLTIGTWWKARRRRAKI